MPNAPGGLGGLRPGWRRLRNAARPAARRARRRRAEIARRRARLSARFREPGPAGLARVRTALAGYFSGAHLDSEAGRRDLEHVHLTGRLHDDRSRMVPWLDEARPLDGARVLEIGCGTGSATVALAEQGARVTGVDLDARALAVARERCAAYGVSAELAHCNATDAAKQFAGERFDFAIFYASLEHMTGSERLAAISSTWDLLPDGGLWCVVKCPNRLWYRDGHSSWLPFYHWLPDDLAFAYARFSPRAGYGDRHRDDTPDGRLAWLRRGRGVSYHELHLALGAPERLEVVSSLGTHLGGLHPVGSLKHRYEAVLREIRPDLHPGFFEPQLNLLVRKR